MIEEGSRIPNFVENEKEKWETSIMLSPWRDDHEGENEEIMVPMVYNRQTRRRKALPTLRVNSTRTFQVPRIILATQEESDQHST